MSKILTAEQFINQSPIFVDMWNDTRGQGTDYNKEFTEGMKEFAKLHVKSALKAAAENAELGKRYPGIGISPITTVDKNSILNAYPDNLIQ